MPRMTQTLSTVETDSTRLDGTGRCLALSMPCVGLIRRVSRFRRMCLSGEMTAWSIRRPRSDGLPTGAERLALSKLNMLGLGTAMMKDVMKRQRIMSLPSLMKSAKEAGVRFIARDMAMGVMGLTRDELIDEVDEVAGVAAFAELAKKSNNTLFI